MRFLVPVVMLIATFLVISRQPQQQGEEGTAAGIYAPAVVEEVNAEATDVNADYDETIEASGLLNRLDLLDF